MKKRIPLLVGGLALALCLVAGCSLADGPAGTTNLYGKADNEIFSYEKPESGKTQLVIGIVENDDVTEVVKAFSEKYPDVQPMLYYLQKGDDAYSPAKDWVRHGYAPDVVYNLDFGQDNGTYLEDLSGRKAATAYYTESLENSDSSGRFYHLPGPAKVMGIAYNKTLFDQYGWTVPKTFDEFIALCDQIKSDTGGSVEAYNPNGKYASDFTGGMEAFAYTQLFGGVANRQWYNDVINGNAAFSGHMEPYFQMAQTMIDHGLLTPSSFNYSYTTRTKNFLSGKIAMMNVFTDLDTTNSDGYAFAYMPFPATSGTSQYLTTRQSFNLSVVKKSRSTAQETAVSEFLDFVSTPEAQKLYMGSGFMVSSVKDTPVNDVANLANLKEQIDNGFYFKRLDFDGGKIADTFNVIEAMRLQMQSMASGQTTASGAVTAMDTAVSGAVSSPSAGEDKKTVATVKTDFTVLETSEFITDAFKAATDADIALIPDNSIYRGNIHRLFAGDLTEAMITNMLPRSFDNGSKLVKVTMTGENLVKALNDPPDFSGGSADCVYAFSGLKAKVAPWNDPGGKYLSVTLADGSEIDPAAQYTVAFWQGMVKDQYISQIQQKYDTTYAALLKDAAAQASELSPVSDGRISLVWK